MPASVMRADRWRLSAADAAVDDPISTQAKSATAAIATSLRRRGMCDRVRTAPARSARPAETVGGPAVEQRRLGVRPARMRGALALEIARGDRLAGIEAREDRLDRAEQDVRHGDVGRRERLVQRVEDARL